MTQAQALVEEFKSITAPGRQDNTWKWALRVTKDLTALGRSTIGQRHTKAVAAIEEFRCADGSRFAFDLNGARQVWAMPDDRLAQ